MNDQNPVIEMTNTELKSAKGPNQRGNRIRESLPTFITLHKARALYHWEVAADTKLFQDSSLGNSVCTSRYTLCRLSFKWQKHKPFPILAKTIYT